MVAEADGPQGGDSSEDAAEVMGNSYSLQLRPAHRDSYIEGRACARRMSRRRRRSSGASDALGQRERADELGDGGAGGEGGEEGRRLDRLLAPHPCSPMLLQAANSLESEVDRAIDAAEQRPAGRHAPRPTQQRAVARAQGRPRFEVFCQAAFCHSKNRCSPVIGT